MTTATAPVTNPDVTRSRLVLEIASDMAGGSAGLVSARRKASHGAHWQRDLISAK